MDCVVDEFGSFDLFPIEGSWDGRECIVRKVVAGTGSYGDVMQRWFLDCVV